MCYNFPGTRIIVFPTHYSIHALSFLSVLSPDGIPSNGFVYFSKRYSSPKLLPLCQVSGLL